MANENKINWTLVVLGTILCIGLYLVPSPLQSTHRIVVHTIDSTWLVPGTPDTSGVVLPPVTGSATSSTTATTTTDSVNSTYDYFFYSEVNDSTKEGDKISIQTFVYPYEENDTLKANIINNWEIQSRPAVEIVQVDTLFKVTTIPEEVPFYEKPYVVAPVTAGVVIALVYIIAGAFK